MGKNLIARWSDDVDTRRYNEVPTEEVSESWILEVLQVEDEFGARPPTAPKTPPIPRLFKKIRLPKPGASS